jgi:hypothetical protein
MIDAKRKFVELDRNELNKTFKDNHVPFILIAPDREFYLLPQDLVAEYNNSEYSPPQSLIDETRARIDCLIKFSKKEGFTFFDDVLGRVDDVSVHSNKLLLKFSKTSYLHFAALNKGLDLPLSNMSGSTTLREGDDDCTNWRFAQYKRR